MQPFPENKEVPLICTQKGTLTPVFLGIHGERSPAPAGYKLRRNSLVSGRHMGWGPKADANFPLTCLVTLVINSLVEISFPVLKYGMTENTAAGFTAPHGVQL